MSCFCHLMNWPSSEELHIAIGPWSIIDACCVMNLCPWVFIAIHWTVTNWSSLQPCLPSVRWFKVRADLNMLNHLEMIWSTKPIWNIFIIWYFLSVINSNNWCSNEILVGVEIWTSDLQERRWARYQLSYAPTLSNILYIYIYIWPVHTYGRTNPM